MNIRLSPEFLQPIALPAIRHTLSAIRYTLSAIRYFLPPEQGIFEVFNRFFPVIRGV
jgi:hypothetical protein